MIFASGGHAREAWIPEAAPQCASCRSRLIAATLELLLRNPRPSDGELSQVMESSCRCEGAAPEPP